MIWPGRLKEPGPKLARILKNHYGRTQNIYTIQTKTGNCKYMTWAWKTSVKNMQNTCLQFSLCGRWNCGGKFRASLKCVFKIFRCLGKQAFDVAPRPFTSALDTFSQASKTSKLNKLSFEGFFDALNFASEQTFKVENKEEFMKLQRSLRISACLWKSLKEPGRLINCIQGPFSANFYDERLRYGIYDEKKPWKISTIPYEYSKMITGMKERGEPILTDFSSICPTTIPLP